MSLALWRTINMNETHQLEVFYDGHCPLCTREIAWLRRRDPHNKVLFTDLTDPHLDLNALGRTYDELMGHIHGRLEGGRWLTGVDLFEKLYAAVGLGWLMAPARWRLTKPLMYRSYTFFAKHRLRLTGRRCSEGSCRIS